MVGDFEVAQQDRELVSWANANSYGLGATKL